MHFGNIGALPGRANRAQVSGNVDAPQAPQWEVSQWFNARATPTLSALRGKVIVLHAFQMLCPGCVAHGTPQAQRIVEGFDAKDVVVVGLHTVFEHHDVMTPRALEVFIHENRLTFPIGVDASGGENPIPQTMRAYQMQGTPSLVLIDRAGRIRMHEFGALPDLSVGAAIGRLIGEA
jgi:peroxiredoxin